MIASITLSRSLAAKLECTQLCEIDLIECIITRTELSISVFSMQVIFKCHILCMEKY